MPLSAIFCFPRPAPSHCLLAALAHQPGLVSFSVYPLPSPHQPSQQLPPALPRALSLPTQPAAIAIVGFPSGPNLSNICLVWATNLDRRLRMSSPCLNPPFYDLQNLHQSPPINLLSWSNLHSLYLISGSPSEFILWDISFQPRPLRALGRQFIPRNPYSPSLSNLVLSPDLSQLLSHFDDHSLSRWDLDSLLRPDPDPHLLPLATTPPSIYPITYSPDFTHVFALNHQNSILHAKSNQILGNLPSNIIHQFTCISYDHLNHHVHFLVLIGHDRQLATIRIDNLSHQPRLTKHIIQFNCIQFKFFPCQAITVFQCVRQDPTIMSTLQILQKSRPGIRPSRPIVSEIPENPTTCILTWAMIASHDETIRASDEQLISLLQEQLRINLSFPFDLRLPIYSRLLAEPGSNESTTTQYYTALAKPSPEAFLKKFRLEWKLEQPRFQFLLETLLSIFHGSRRYSDELLIDQLSPILYSLLTVLFPNVQEFESEFECLDIYLICHRILNKFCKGLLDVTEWNHFTNSVTKKLENHNQGQNILNQFDQFDISLDEILRSMTHGFFMGFLSPQCFASLMDHLIIDYSSINSIEEISFKLLMANCDRVLNHRDRSETLKYFSETQDVSIQKIREM